MNEWEILTEAIINAVHVDSGRKIVQLDLTCRCGVNVRKKLIISGVNDLVINEMRLSNIVDRVNLYRGGEEDISSQLFRLIRGREANAEDLKWSPLLEKLSLIRAGKLLMVEIEPVYGASALILGEDIQLSSID